VIGFEIPSDYRRSRRVPVMECRYGLFNGQYALKVEKMLASAATNK